MASRPARIAKTLSLRVGERVVLIVAAGTSRMDNKKVKAQFGGKPKMLGLDEVAEITGHEVGGVCPFGLKTPLPVYCDVSLKAFDVVVPAAGSTHSAVRITPDADGGTDRGRMGRCLRAQAVTRARVHFDSSVSGFDRSEVQVTSHLAAPAAVGTAAITYTMRMAPAPVPPAETRLHQVALLHHRLGGAGQRSGRSSHCRYAEQYRANHEKCSRNFGHGFGLGHDIPPIHSFRPQSTWLTAIRCTVMTVSGWDRRSLNRDGARCDA